MKYTKEELEQAVISVTWCAQDLINEYGFKPKRAMELINSMAGSIEEAMMRAGWEAIEALLVMEDQ